MQGVRHVSSHGISFLFYGTEIMMLPCHLHRIIVLNGKIFGTMLQKLLHGLHLLNKETQLPAPLEAERMQEEWEKRGKIDNPGDT